MLQSLAALGCYNYNQLTLSLEVTICPARRQPKWAKTSPWTNSSQERYKTARSPQTLWPPSALTPNLPHSTPVVKANIAVDPSPTASQQHLQKGCSSANEGKQWLLLGTGRISGSLCILLVAKILLPYSEICSSFEWEEIHGFGELQHHWEWNLDAAQVSISQ